MSLASQAWPYLQGWISQHFLCKGRFEEEHKRFQQLKAQGFNGGDLVKVSQDAEEVVKKKHLSLQVVTQVISTSQ